MFRVPSLTLLASVGLAGTTALLLASSSGSAPAASRPSASADVARGGYLVSIMGCHDCHTPWAMGPTGPAPDMSRALSGHPQDLAMGPAPALGDGGWLWAGGATNTAFAGPWGTSFAANLTPDRATGLGSWTAEIFIQAIREARHEGQGRPLLPPMPAPVYANATDQDLRAIFAYLQSLPAISNRVPQPVDPAEVR